MSPFIGSDHGVKAQGDGWLLTVALIEGSNLAAVDASGFSDPYVVFTCNGKTRTSSIKFQKSNPQWNGSFCFLTLISLFLISLIILLLHMRSILQRIGGNVHLFLIYKLILHLINFFCCNHVVLCRNI